MTAKARTIYKFAESEGRDQHSDATLRLRQAAMHHDGDGSGGVWSHGVSIFAPAIPFPVAR